MEDVIKHQNVNHYKSFVIKVGGQWSKKMWFKWFFKAIFNHNSCICFILIPCSHPINISCPLTSYLNLLGNLLNQQPVGGTSSNAASSADHSKVHYTHEWLQNLHHLRLPWSVSFKSDPRKEQCWTSDRVMGCQGSLMYVGSKGSPAWFKLLLTVQKNVMLALSERCQNAHCITDCCL